MISFKFFVNAIHDAILSANDTLMEKNTGMLDKYFVDNSNEDELQASLDHALQTTTNIVSKKGAATPDDFKAALDALESAKKALSPTDDNKTNTIAGTPGTLSPKSVVIEYPHQTANGIEFVEVHVPLITLVPLTMSHIEKAKLSANFEMEIVNDELQLNFTNKPRGRFGRKSKRTWGQLEITISPQESSEGLKQLVEGYEQALKNQIPH